MSETKSDQTETASDSEVLKAVQDMLEARIPVMGESGLQQLQADCTDEGRERLAIIPHHTVGTTERWAWHAGYVAAMADTLNMIKERIGEYPIKMRR